MMLIHLLSPILRIIKENSMVLKKIKDKKTLIKFLTSSFITIPISLVVSFVSLRMIDPYYLGLWASLTIIETYSTFLRFGVVNGMNRELPYAIGSGEIQSAKEIVQTTLFYTILTSILVIFFSPSLYLFFGNDSITLVSLTVIILMVILNQYSTFLTGTFRTSDNFNKLSNIQFIIILVKLASIPLIYYFSFFGYVLMHLIVSLIGALLLHIYRPFNYKPKFFKNKFIQLIKIGFPVFLSSFAIGFIDTFPKLFILHFGNTKLLGIYAPVLAMIAVFSSLPNSLGAYFSPKLTYQLAKLNNPKLMYTKILKIYGLSIIALLPFALVLYLFLDYFAILFPKYVDSIRFLEIGLFIAPFVIAKLGNIISIILKQVNFMLYYVSMYAVFQIGYLLLFYNLFLDDVLLSVVLSQILTLASLLISSIYLNSIAVKKYISIQSL